MTKNSFVYGYHYYNLRPESNSAERYERTNRISLMKKLSSLVNKKASRA